MSKKTNEKIISDIASADAKVARIAEGKKRAQAQLDKADQEIAETKAARAGYVALLAARGLDEKGEPVDTSKAAPADDWPLPGDGDEVAQPDEPQFG